jgi:glycosyltransferase involved in cell wall biosynthesis
MDMTPNRSLRVLFVPQWYPYDGNQMYGTFVREHVHAARLHDHVAVLVVTSRSDRWPSLRWKRVEDEGVPTFYGTYGHSPVPKTTLPFFYVHLRRALRRVFREWGVPDVLHAQDLQAYAVMRALWPQRIPIVVSQQWTGFMERSLNRTQVRQFRSIFSRASRVLAANQFGEVDYRHYRLSASVAWLPNTIDERIFTPPTNARREPWLLHASGFTPVKRVGDIIRGFARIHARRPDAVLHLVGEGQGRADMERFASRELPHTAYRFHGLLSKIELAALMRRAAGFVFPSAAETFGCVLMEAMASGCPVLTTRIGGIPGVVREGEGLFVDVGNIEQIKEGMLTLLNGTHGLDMERICRETRERFSHVAVGRILHQEHTRAAHGASSATFPTWPGRRSLCAVDHTSAGEPSQTKSGSLQH